MNRTLKFLVDESTGRELYNFLSAKGYDVKFVSNIMPKASDNDVSNFAE